MKAILNLFFLVNLSGSGYYAPDKYHNQRSSSMAKPLLFKLSALTDAPPLVQRIEVIANLPTYNDIH